MNKSITRHQFVVFLIIFWALTFVHIVRAATMHEFMGGYDQNLLQWAAASSLLGGGIRTILSLESDKRVITDIASTAVWDAVKSLVAGMLAFIVIQAIRSSGMLVPSEIRFTAVLVAGWARTAAIDWIFNAGLDWINSRKTQIVNRPANDKPPKDAP